MRDLYPFIEFNSVVIEMSLYLLFEETLSDCNQFKEIIGCLNRF